MDWMNDSSSPKADFGSGTELFSTTSDTGGVLSDEKLSDDATFFIRLPLSLRRWQYSLHSLRYSSTTNSIMSIIWQSSTTLLDRSDASTDTFSHFVIGQLHSTLRSDSTLSVQGQIRTSSPVPLSPAFFSTSSSDTLEMGAFCNSISASLTCSSCVVHSVSVELRSDDGVKVMEKEWIDASSCGDETMGEAHTPSVIDSIRKSTLKEHSLNSASTDDPSGRATCLTRLGARALGERARLVTMDWMYSTVRKSDGWSVTTVGLWL